MNLRKNPCRFCPYRRDVPSGVWHESEYRKLIDYDAPTPDQPMAIFGCHEKPNTLCAGWTQAHGINGPCGLLALRILSAGKYGSRNIQIPVSKIPLFKSGTEAATHGLTNINRPRGKAIPAMKYLEERLKQRKK